MTGWLFGYGSLIWRPDFPFEARSPARLSGWSRRFWQRSPDHRGTPASPGRVVTLVPDPTGETWGIAYQISPMRLAAIFEELDVREQAGYVLRTVEVAVSHRAAPIVAHTYIGQPGSAMFVGEESLADTAAVVATSHGPSGSNLDYVSSLARALREMSVVDEHVFALERAAVERTRPR